MRKNSIVRSYRDQPVAGVINMNEKNNFLCGKMMDIEDVIRVRSRTTSDTFDVVKMNAITGIRPDESQSKSEQDRLTLWVMDFDARFLLTEYLYNEVYTQNPFSVFRQMDHNLTESKKNGDACLDYIRKNILDRYRLKEFILWTKFFELRFAQVPGTGSSASNPAIKLLRMSPVYNFNAVPTPSNPDEHKETISTKEYLDGTYEIRFKQRMSSQTHTFIYYYDVVFERV
jgi:hypothetical protein